MEPTACITDTEVKFSEGMSSSPYTNTTTNQVADKIAISSASKTELQQIIVVILTRADLPSIAWLSQAQ